MLEVVWSSGVVGRSGRRPPNWEPNESDGRRERLGVGNLGLVLRLDVKEVWVYDGSRLKFADISAVREAMGLSISHRERDCKSK